ncbi:hypothetical protein [Haloferax larsenii]|uniref:Uncharacterized protein n=1 Tax=Haloferax larsenii TaxID=302484 RepID=A0A1H7T3K7_HALLR|nr:hypothetical protein [Haloferax larsenii]SEL79470.1 hypothetical protein SAMN04488691_10860 [Haloferax larsenii]
MDALITGEGDGIVGLSVIDNNDVEHLIEVSSDGEITGHQQDGYPDDSSKREPWEGQNVMQARNYARFYVARERGYDTITQDENPDRINAARHALSALSNDDFLDLFGAYCRQHRSHYDDSVTRPVSLPESIDEDDYFQYELGIYLDIDQDRLDEKAADLSELLTEAALEQDEGTLERVQNVLGTDGGQKALTGETVQHLTQKADERNIDITDIVEIDAVSGVHVRWEDEVGLINKRVEERRQEGAIPYDREPDALVQLPPFDTGALDNSGVVQEFKDFLCYHLQCQVRDCFVGMGIEPPHEFRVVGPGLYHYAIRYKQLDFYPPLHDLTSDAIDLDQWHEDGLIESNPST